MGLIMKHTNKNKVKWSGELKKFTKYNIDLPKEYIEMICIALEQKADWHLAQESDDKNKKVDECCAMICRMVNDCILEQYNKQNKN